MSNEMILCFLSSSLFSESHWQILYVSGWGCDRGGEGAGERVGRTGTNMLNEKKMK